MNPIASERLLVHISDPVLLAKGSVEISIGDRPRTLNRTLLTADEFGLEPERKLVH
jgi:hypothetical protein